MTARWSGGKGNGMPDDDFVVADQDLLDQQSDDALTLDYVESFGRRAQAGEKRGQRFSETQIGGAVGRMVCDRLQLGAGRVLAPTQLGHTVAQLIERKKVPPGRAGRPANASSPVWRTVGRCIERARSAALSEADQPSMRLSAGRP